MSHYSDQTLLKCTIINRQTRQANKSKAFKAVFHVRRKYSLGDNDKFRNKHIISHSFKVDGFTMTSSNPKIQIARSSEFLSKIKDDLEIKYSILNFRIFTLRDTKMVAATKLVWFKKKRSLPKFFSSSNISSTRRCVYVHVY